MRGGRRRRGVGGGRQTVKGGTHPPSPPGGWRRQSRGEGVNRRKRQASPLIKSHHSHHPYQNLVACLHKTTNNNCLLPWPYIISRPHPSRNHDRLLTTKWEDQNGEGARKGGKGGGGGGGGGRKGASAHDHVGDGTWTSHSPPGFFSNVLIAVHII